MVAAVSAFAGHFSPCKSALRAQPGISLRHHHLRRRHQHPVASNVLPPQESNRGNLELSSERSWGILNQRAVEARDLERPILDIRTGDVLEIKLQVPENKRRLAVYKGIVRIHTTIRIRRIIAGVGVEIVLPLKMRFTMSIAAPIAF